MATKNIGGRVIEDMADGLRTKGPSPANAQYVQPQLGNSFGDAAAVSNSGGKTVGVGEMYVRDGRGGGAVQPNPAYDARGAAKVALDEGLRQQGQAANRAGAMAMNERMNTADLLKKPSAPVTAASTPRPVSPLAMEPPIDASKLLTKPSAGTIPVQPTGATNATAGATQGVGNTGPAMANNPGGAGGGGAGVSAEVAKRTGLRGALDTAKGVGGNALKSAASAPGVGVVSAAGQAFKEADNFGPGELSGLADAYGNSKLNGKEPSPENVDTITRVYEGMGRVGLSGAGAAAGFKTGLQAPGGPWVKGAAALGLGAAGAYFGPKVSDAAVGAGRAALEGDFDKALAIGTGQQAPVMTPPGAGSANAQAAAQPTLRQDPLRVQEARSNIADPGRAAVPLPPESLREAEDLKNPMSNASIQKANPGGQIMKTVDENGRTVYSGGKVSGLASFTDADGKALRGQAGGGLIQGSGDGSFRFASPKEMAGLTNPDGSRWSANDNAIMAANLRDGVDPYRGTSRGAAQTQGGVSPGMARIAAAEQQLGVPLGKARRAQAVADETAANNQRTNATTLRGQDMDLEGRLGPKRMEMELAQRQRDAIRQAIDAATPRDKDGKPTGEADRTLVQQYLADAGYTAAAEAQGNLVKNVQNQGAKANEIKDANVAAFNKLFAGQAIQESKDGTPERNKDIEASQAAEALRLNPNIINAPREAQGAYAIQAAADRGLRLKINEGNEGGWASWLPTKLMGLQKDQGTFQSLPDPSWWEGAELSGKVGNLRGALTPNLESGDRYITLRGGSTLNLGNLTAEQIARIDGLTGQSKRKAKSE